MKIFQSKYKRILDNLNDSIRNPNKEHMEYLKIGVLEDINKIHSHQHKKRLMTIRDVAINRLLMEKHK